MILSLGRFGIAPAEATRTLEKGWAAYRKEKGLDLYGVAAGAEVSHCVHSGDQ
jgi:hypothetical protein